MASFIPRAAEKIQVLWDADRSRHPATYRVLQVRADPANAETTHVLLEKCGKNDYVANLVIDNSGVGLSNGALQMRKPLRGGGGYESDRVLGEIRRVADDDSAGAASQKERLRRAEVSRLHRRMRGHKSAAKEPPLEIPGYITGKSKNIVEVCVFDASPSALHYPGGNDVVDLPTVDLQQELRVFSLPPNELLNRDCAESLIKHKVLISKLFGNGLQSRDVQDFMAGAGPSSPPVSAGGADPLLQPPLVPVRRSAFLCQLAETRDPPELVNFREYRLYAEFECDCGVAESEEGGPGRDAVYRWDTVKCYGGYWNPKLATDYENEEDRDLINSVRRLNLRDATSVESENEDEDPTYDDDDNISTCGCDRDRKKKCGCLHTLWYCSTEHQNSSSASRWKQWANVSETEKPKQICRKCEEPVEAIKAEVFWDHHPHGQHLPEYCPKCIRKRAYCSEEPTDVCEIYKLILRELHPDLTWKETPYGMMSEFLVTTPHSRTGGEDGETLRVLLRIEPQLFFINEAEATRTAERKGSGGKGGKGKGKGRDRRR
ncbi:unnamed protein product [Amoebophrya sp. A120]|nr:unnamed protein product [Amoebophrya sp. A120]|eukprot:GSA120T00000795001.1